MQKRHRLVGSGLGAAGARHLLQHLPGVSRSALCRNKAQMGTRTHDTVNGLVTALRGLQMASRDVVPLLTEYINVEASPLLALIAVLKAIAAAVVEASDSGKKEEDAAETGDAGAATAPERSDAVKPTGPPPRVLLTAHFGTAAALLGSLLPPGALPAELVPIFVEMFNTLPIVLCAKLAEGLCSGSDNAKRVSTSADLTSTVIRVCTNGQRAAQYNAVITLLLATSLTPAYDVVPLLEACAQRNLLGQLAKIVSGPCSVVWAQEPPPTPLCPDPHAVVVRIPGPCTPSCSPGPVPEGQGGALCGQIPEAEIRVEAGGAVRAEPRRVP